MIHCLVIAVLDQSETCSFGDLNLDVFDSAIGGN